LIDFLDKQILAMKADGSLAKLQVKWFGMAMTLPDTIPSK
jgi:polar amino acid transport system substrate-binding protein